ncbi:hypothetical protein XENORESO_020976, partial [Xenotaenia resolanae]
RKMRQTECFNKRHRTRDLDRLLPGLQMQKHRAVTSVHLNPRSYVIIGPHGTVRRNRSHLVPMPTPEAQTEPTQSSEKNLPAETVCQLLDSLWCNVTLVDGAQSDSGGPVHSFNAFILQKLLTHSSHMRSSIVLH